MKDFISKNKLNTEILNELKRVEEVGKKLRGIKCSINDAEKHYFTILQEIKRYVLLEVILKMVT